LRYLESTARLKRVGKALRPAADMQDLTILFVFFSDVGVCSRVCYSKNELLTSTSHIDRAPFISVSLSMVSTQGAIRNRPSGALRAPLLSMIP